MIFIYLDRAGDGAKIYEAKILNLDFLERIWAKKNCKTNFNSESHLLNFAILSYLDRGDYRTESYEAKMSNFEFLKKI